MPNGVQDIKPRIKVKLLNNSRISDDNSFQDRIFFLVENPRILDAASIIIFATGFICFNLHYWFIADYDPIEISGREL